MWVVAPGEEEEEEEEEKEEEEEEEEEEMQVKRTALNNLMKTDCGNSK